jgi:EAL and modified HD-GYP domain-containing signal transduction protein
VIDVFAARQAIYDSRKNIIAYEVFFRDNINNYFNVGMDSYDATAKLIMRTQYSDGIASFTSEKKAFINFCEKSLLNGLPYMLPKEHIAIEILEDVPPTEEILNVIKKLHKEKYYIILDDFVYDKKWDKFFPYINMIKFDIIKSSLGEISEIVRELKKYKSIRLLAEKIETEKDFITAKNMGFEFFQGYFLGKPEMKTIVEVESSSTNLLYLYQKAIHQTYNPVAISKFFESDLNMSIILLKYVNLNIVRNKSKVKVKSIRDAIDILSVSEIKKFVLLLLRTITTKKKPDKILNKAIYRAKLAELLAEEVDTLLAGSAFMSGLLSMSEDVYGKPLSSLLNIIPIDENIKKALLGESETKLFFILELAKLIENGDLHLANKKAILLKLSFKDICRINNSTLYYLRKYSNISVYNQRELILKSNLM